MSNKITKFKTELYIVRERCSGGNWTVEEKDGNNVIAEVNTDSNPFTLDMFFRRANRSEMLELAEILQRVDNITKNR